MLGVFGDTDDPMCSEEIEPHEREIFGRPYVGEEGGMGPIERCDVTGEPAWMCECLSCEEDRDCVQAEQIWEMEMEKGYEDP